MWLVLNQSEICDGLFCGVSVDVVVHQHFTLLVEDQYFKDITHRPA